MKARLVKPVIHDLSSRSSIFTPVSPISKTEILSGLSPCLSKRASYFLLPRKIVLGAIQDEGSRGMIRNAYKALIKVGASNPLMRGYRGSFALLGYTGPGRLPFIRQVRACVNTSFHLSNVILSFASYSF